MAKYSREIQSFTERPLHIAGTEGFKDLSKEFAADQGTLPSGLVVKGTGKDRAPWIKGADAADLITGVLFDELHTDADTSEVVGRVRVFGSVNGHALVAWTAANGSTQDEGNAVGRDAFDAMEEYGIYVVSSPDYVDN